MINVLSKTLPQKVIAPDTRVNFNDEGFFVEVRELGHFSGDGSWENYRFFKWEEVFRVYLHDIGNKRYSLVICLFYQPS